MRRGTVRTRVVIAAAVAVGATVVPTSGATVAAPPPPGVFTTVAGAHDTPGYLGNCQDPTEAHLGVPLGISLASDGSVAFSDLDSRRVRRIEPGAVSIATFAGGGSGGDGGPATDAALGPIDGVAHDGAGNTYVAEFEDHRVRVVAPDGAIETIAGNGVDGDFGDGGLAGDASIEAPARLAYDPVRHALYIGGASSIRVVDLGSKRIDTVTSAGGARGLAVSADGDVLFASVGHEVVAIDIDSGNGVVVAGTGSPGFAGDGGPATSASLHQPAGLAVTKDGNLVVADRGNHRLRRVDLGADLIDTVAGTGTAGGSGDGGPAAGAQLHEPYGLAVDGDDQVWVTEAQGHRIRLIDAKGTITRVAGTGILAYSGDSDSACVHATDARFSTPRGLVHAPDGSALFVAEPQNHRVRRIDLGTGLVSTVAGTGVEAFSGDGGPAREAALDTPTELEVHPNGDLFVYDDGNFRIRRISATDGTISTVAGTGNPGPDPFAVPGPAATTPVYNVRQMHVSADGRLLFATFSPANVWSVDLTTGILDRVAGVPSGVEGDDTTALTMELDTSQAVHTDDAGNLYVGDRGRLTRFDAHDGTATVIAGNGTTGVSGDGGPAVDATVSVTRLEVDPAGNVYLGGAGRVRRIDRAGTIDTVAGGGTAVPGDGELATDVALAGIRGVVVGPGGDLFLSVLGRHTIHRVAMAPAAGLLRVTTSPAVPAAVTVDGVPRNDWGLEWLPVEAGTREVCAGPVPGFDGPPTCTSVVVPPGGTGTAELAFAPRGYLRVTTDPPVPATIVVDKVPRNDWGLWTSVAPGSYEVCAGAVEGFTPPACETVVVAPGQTAHHVAQYTATPGAPGPDPAHGLLRVTTSPAVPARILVDGAWTDDWGLTWTKRPAGTVEVCAEAVPGFRTPDCQTVQIHAGEVSEVPFTFVPEGYLQVATSPPVPATIHVDGEAANVWGLYRQVPTGTHTVCFGRVPGSWSPPCEEVTVTAGATTTVTGTYQWAG